MLYQGSLLAATQQSIQFSPRNADVSIPFSTNRTTIAMADYEMEDNVYELNFESARIAKEAAEEATAKDPSKPRFVMGSLGPTNRTGSISPVSAGGVGVGAQDDVVVDTRRSLERDPCCRRTVG